MSKPLVIELQELASDSEVPVTDVLRRALIVATKLRIKDFHGWIENELNGYREKKVPDYRIIRGRPTVTQVYTGHSQPMAFDSDELRTKFSVRSIGQPISEIQHLVSKSGGTLVIEYSAEIQNAMNEESSVRVGHYYMVLSQTSLVGILNRVRDIVLQWSLKLEEAEILGDGLQFSASEKDAAKNPELQAGKFMVINAGVYVAGNMQGGNATGGDSG